MASEPKLAVLFLWHQHQPYYKDPLSNRYELPWVRLHATKDYYDMVAVLEEFPKIRSNFNLVPSLLLQLEDYAQGKAHDRFLGVSRKSAAELSFDEKQFILQYFFMANWPNMIDPYPRYSELLDKRGRSGQTVDLSRTQNYFKEQDWRDLQVWFNLTWFDPYWREKDSFIAGLFEKGKHFTEQEKNDLLDRQIAICAQIALKHRELMEKEQIDITTTPFYHPILPLLCDTESARINMPQVILPAQPFQHPKDAREQIRRALIYHKHLLGRRPIGMWPSEGSVSPAVAELFVESGVKWIATDEAVLARSMSDSPFERDDLYDPYRFITPEGPLDFFFRDHELSDAIGFVYASWNAEDAVTDFIGRLHDIRKRLLARDGEHPRQHVVSVILDGENCWEYYKDDGLPFLRSLYRRLSDDPLLETVRASEYLGRTTDRRTLPQLWTGSWINANFGIWIGHSEDNQAWTLLKRTRDFLMQWGETHPDIQETEPYKMAWEAIYAAEGSDWCWWYGDDHSSANDDVFDYLFRKHLMNVYTLLGQKPPEDLHLAIKIKRAQAQILPPVDFLSPTIDGKITSFFEWQSAGQYQTEAGATGTMHRAQNLVKTIHFGFDLTHLYFRLDLSRPPDPITLAEHVFRFVFLSPENHEVEARLQSDRSLSLIVVTPAKNQTNPLPVGRAGKIIELAIPLSALSLSPRTPLQVFLQIDKQGIEQERWPIESTLSIPYPAEDAFAESWII